MSFLNLRRWLRALAAMPGFRFTLLLFVGLRIFLTLWAMLSLQINPLPPVPDEGIRPYLGQPVLREGAAGLLLGPWQRFDALRYTRIAQNGYANEEDSVFPPLFPLAVRGLGEGFGGGHAAYMAAALLISNVACFFLLLLTYRVAAAELNERLARRTVLYLAIFPSGFFLFAGYTESLFILLALGSVWQGRNGRFVSAGVLGLLASLTRLTGWILVVPLAYEWWRQRETAVLHKEHWPAVMAIPLPAVGTAAFFLYRLLIGLPPLSDIYAQYWYQTTGIPGADLLTALNTMLGGGLARAGEFTLWFDFFCTLLLAVTTVLAFRRLGVTWGLYAAMLLLFMLLPTSPVKPLYSFSRYTLAFIPTFMLLAQAGQNGIVHRLILYPSVGLYLYFSGQFFIWGWVA